jgi:hypothetical protein
MRKPENMKSAFYENNIALLRKRLLKANQVRAPPAAPCDCQSVRYYRRFSGIILYGSQENCLAHPRRQVQTCKYCCNMDFFYSKLLSYVCEASVGEDMTIM